MYMRMTMLGQQQRLELKETVKNSIWRPRVEPCGSCMSLWNAVNGKSRRWKTIRRESWYQHWHAMETCQAATAQNTDNIIWIWYGQYLPNALLPSMAAGLAAGGASWCAKRVNVQHCPPPLGKTRKKSWTFWISSSICIGIPYVGSGVGISNRILAWLSAGNKARRLLPPRCSSTPRSCGSTEE